MTLWCQSLRPFPACHGRRIICAVLFGVGIFGFAPRTRGQVNDPRAIRVESDNVLVPVLVLDERRLDEIQQMDPVTFIKEANAPGSHLLKDVALTGLSAADFRVFEDGKEQVVGQLIPETLPNFNAAPPAGGDSSSPNLPSSAPANLVSLPNWPGYVIGYTPSPSPDGSCHQVVVKVDRPGSLVYARSGYCNVRHAANDMLRGTQLGTEMEADLNSGNKGALAVSLIAFPAFGDTRTTYHTDVIVEHLTKPRRLADCTRSPEVEVLGILSRTDGTIAARFSGPIGEELSSDGQRLSAIAPGQDKSCVQSGPDVYGTRLDLSPGQYVLRVILREGKKFGRAEMPITLVSYAGQQLATSDIVLARTYRQMSDKSLKDVTATPAGQYTPLTSKGFEVIPTADTRFKKGEPFDFYVELYHPQQAGTTSATVAAHLRIVDAKTGRVMKGLDPVDAAPYAMPGDPVIPIGGGIDISELPKGSYELQVQATDSTGQTTPWRTARFTIE